MMPSWKFNANDPYDDLILILILHSRGKSEDLRSYLIPSHQLLLSFLKNKLKL